MTEIFVSLGEVIDDNVLQSLRTRLKSLDAGDEITIRMEAADAHQADRVFEELKEHGFDYQPRGGHENEYFLKAKKSPDA